jgi:predicted membrane-bound dolichyl-phosphate-mannose-protein mannosyltransferase
MRLSELFARAATWLRTSRWSWIGLLLVVGLVYGARLNRPETGLLEDGKWLYSYDENYTVLTARRIAAGDPNVWDAWRHPDDHDDRLFTMRFRAWDLGNDDSRYEWVHPPTPRVIMAAIIRAAGMNAALYRLPSVAMGLLVVAMTWTIGCRMRGPGFGLFAGALAASDGWLFCLSRVAMTDVYFIAPTIAAYALFYVWWTAARHRRAWMLAVGAACGAALAMKWSAAAPVLGLVGMTAFRLVLDWRASAPGERDARRRVLVDTALALASFTVVPVTIYVASFWPFFAAGHSFAEWGQLHSAIVAYNRTAPPTAPGSAPWYIWPLDKGFTWFLTRAKEGRCQYTFASSNWFVWWPFIFVIVYALERFVEERRFEHGFLVVATAAMWLPYAFVHRFVFTRYFTMLVPIAALALAQALFDIHARWPRYGGALRAGHLAAAIVFFVIKYPAWAGVALPCRVTQGNQWDYWLHARR